jgi:predicted nucleic acid-binding protein
MFLFDTNVVSALRTARREPDAAVARWADGVAHATSFISTITALELQVGVLRVERRDPTQGAVLRRWLDFQVLAGYRGRILDVTLAVALRAASMHVPDPAPDRDALIAATAAVHGLTVVTRNTKHFEGRGVALLNPFDP